jgi:hypothetical protein
MLPDVFPRFLFRIDFLTELIRFRLDTPIDMPADERHVLIVGLAMSIEDPNALADVLERVGIQRRFARGQGGAVKAMLLVFGETGCIISRAG